MSANTDKHTAPPYQDPPVYFDNRNPDGRGENENLMNRRDQMMEYRTLGAPPEVWARFEEWCNRTKQNQHEETDLSFGFRHLFEMRLEQERNPVPTTTRVIVTQPPPPNIWSGYPYQQYNWMNAQCWRTTACKRLGVVCGCITVTAFVAIGIIFIVLWVTKPNAPK